MPSPSDTPIVSSRTVRRDILCGLLDSNTGESPARMFNSSVWRTLSVRIKDALTAAFGNYYHPDNGYSDAPVVLTNLTDHQAALMDAITDPWRQVADVAWSLLSHPDTTWRHGIVPHESILRDKYRLLAHACGFGSVSQLTSHQPAGTVTRLMNAMASSLANGAQYVAPNRPLTDPAYNVALLGNTVPLTHPAFAYLYDTLRPIFPMAFRCVMYTTQGCQRHCVPGQSFVLNESQTLQSSATSSGVMCASCIAGNYPVCGACNQIMSSPTARHGRVNVIRVDRNGNRTAVTVCGTCTQQPGWRDTHPYCVACGGTFDGAEQVVVVQPTVGQLSEYEEARLDYEQWCEEHDPDEYDEDDRPEPVMAVTHACRECVRSARQCPTHGSYLRNNAACPRCTFESQNDPTQARVGVGSHGSSRRLIWFRSHGRQPSRIPHNGDTLYLGVELEVEAMNSMVDTTTMTRYIARPFWRCERDGSLNNGLEIVSDPMDYAQWTEYRPLVEESLALMRGHGYRSFSNNTCGLHVHMSRSAFVSDAHAFHFTRFIYANPALMYAISERSQATMEQWSSLGEPLSYIERKVKSFRENYNHNRYVAVNYANPGTIEVRLFKGTLDPHGFYRKVQFCEALFRFTQPMTTVSSDPATVPTVKMFVEYLEAHAEQYPDLAAFLAVPEPVGSGADA